MRRISYKLVVALFLCSLTIVYMYMLLNTPGKLTTELRFGVAKDQWIITENSNTAKVQANTRIAISFVVCDSRFNESMNVVKSVLLFTKVHVHFVIFTDDVLWAQFNETLTKLKIVTNNQLGFELHKISFPKAHREDWLNLFSKCAAQRLFIPTLISHIDAMIYVDTDTLFLGPVEELWNYFSKFNSSQISAMALEDDNPNVSWYPRFAKHPFYGKYGLNSGVMLMNLTRMREFGWVDYVTPIMLKWKLYIPWGDQDIINIIFHYHERAVYVLSCRYNYRPDQCMYGDACADATSKGVFLLHGSRKAFHNNKQPAFQPVAVKLTELRAENYVQAGDLSRQLLHAGSQERLKAVYQAIDEYELGANPSKKLLANIERYITESPTSNCGNLKDGFLRVPTNTLNLLYSLPDR